MIDAHCYVDLCRITTPIMCFFGCEKAMLEARIQGSAVSLVLQAVEHDPSGKGWTMQVKLSDGVIGEANHPKRSK